MNRNRLIFSVVWLITAILLGNHSLVIAQSSKYCSSSPTDKGFEYLSYVQIGRYEFVTDNSLYSIVNDPSSPVIMYKGGVYDFVLVNQAHYAGDDIACWIDWNNDEIFDVEKERLSIAYDKDLQDNTLAVVEGKIKVPEDAATGLLRMRLVLSNGELCPCASFEYGEVEDYILDVRDIDEKPNVEIDLSTTDIFLGYPVRLKDRSSQYPTSWKWSFKPNTVTFLGDTDASSEQPLVAFDKAGKYDITLEVTNQMGSSSKIFSSAITAHPFKAPLNLAATSNHNYVDLAWAVPLNEGFENYNDFSLSCKPWIQIDNDNQPTGSIMGVNYPNKGYIGSFIIFNPFTTSPVLPFFSPHTGDKMAVCFAANGAPNDDWLISPKVYVEEGDALVFFTRAISQAYNEKFEVAVSTTGTDPDDFEVIAKEVTNKIQWTPYVYNFDKYKGKHIHVAIHCTSSAAFGMAIDDIMLVDGSLLIDDFDSKQTISFPKQQKQFVNNVTRKAWESVLTTERNLFGYKIYRDKELLTQLPYQWCDSYRDKDVTQGGHEYYMIADYSAPVSESLKSNTVTVDVDNTDPYLVITCDNQEWQNNKIYRHRGIIPIGNTYKFPITVENKSDVSKINFESFVLDGEEFSLDGEAPTFLEPGEKRTLTINYKPSSEKSAKGSLTMKSNDIDNSDFTLPFIFNNRADWTYMLYLYEDGTGLNGLKDFNEWEVVGSLPDKVNLLVLYDAQEDMLDGVYYIQKDEKGLNYNIVSSKVHSFGVDVDMNDWHTLRDFIIWGAENFPARHYGLNVWDHGSGIFKAGTTTAIDKGCVGDMKLWEIDKALAEFHSLTNKPMDVLGFDVCLMGQVETVHQLKDDVDYIIACEKTSPGDGWDYWHTFEKMIANPQVLPEDFTKIVIQSYHEAYSSGFQQQNYDGTTISGTNCKAYRANFVEAINQFADELIDHLPEHYNRINTAIEGSWISQNNQEHRDFGNFLQNLKNDQLLVGSLRQAANQMYQVYSDIIIANAYTVETNASVTGLRIWLCNTARSTVNWLKYTDSDKYLKFGDTRWDDFLAVLEDATQNTSPFPVAPETLTGEHNTSGNKLSWTKPKAESVQTALDEDFENPSELKWTLAQSKTLTDGEFDKVGEVHWLVVSEESLAQTTNPKQYIHSGEYSLYIPYSAPDFNWAISPEVFVKEGNELRFWTWYKNNEVSSSDNQVYYTKFHVIVIDNGQYIPVLTWDSQAQKTNTYQEEVVVSLAQFANKLIKVAFVYEYSDGFQMAIDDVSIKTAPEKTSTTHMPFVSNAAKSDFIPYSQYQLPAIINVRTKDGAFASLDDLKGFNIYRDDELIQTINSPELFTYEDENCSAGEHTYYVTALYYGINEESTPSNKVVLGGATSVQEELFAPWTIGPNPTSGICRVQGSKEIEKVEVYNSMGTLVLTKFGDVRELDFSTYASGCYYVKLITSGENATIPVMVQ